MEFTKDETNELRELAQDFVDRLEEFDYQPSKIKDVEDLLELGFYLIDGIQILNMFYDIDLTTNTYVPIYSKFAPFL